MVKEEISRILEELDLSEKEASIYINLLELGQSNVTRLSHKSNINRITTYHLLRSLLKKGLVKSIIKDKVQNFQAVEPKHLLDIVKQKEEKIRSILPELEAMRDTIGKKPSAELYEGKEGIATLLDDVILYAGKEVLSFGNFEIARRSLEYQSLHFRKARIKNKIMNKVITNRMEEDITQEPGWKGLTELRVNENLKEIKTWTMIYGEKVAMFSIEKEPIGIVIENPEIAKTQRFYFDMLWKQSKPFKSTS